jgi:outer membrane autotransporter protein
MRGTISTGLSLALESAIALGFGVALAGHAEAQVLGTAESFGVLAGSTVTNTGDSVIHGNLGVSPGTAITGFPPGIVVPPGAIHSADAVAGQAQVDLVTAYNALMAKPTQFDLTGQDLGGKTLIPAVYRFASSAQLTGLLTLNGQGNSASQFVFKIGSTLTTASNSAVLLINGANGNNVYWVVGSSATLGTNTHFAGNIVALTSITMNTGATITCGRALARNGAVTLDNNTITLCAPDSGGGDSGGEDSGSNDITEDELFGEGVSGTQQTAFDASRRFGSAILAQTVFWREGGFPYFAGGGAGSAAQAYGRGRPDTYRPLKLGPSETESGAIPGDLYQQRKWRLWAAGLGGSTSLEGDHGAADIDTHGGGVAAGLDYRISRTALVGIAGGYTDSELSVDELQTDADVQGSHLGLYGVKSFGQLYLAGTVEYAHFNNQTDRVIDWVLDERARGRFDSELFGGRGELGWRRSFGRHNLTPFVGIDAFNLRSDSFTEDSRGTLGAPGLLGLTYESDSVTSVTSSVGLQLDSHLPLANGRWLTPFVRVAWVHEYNPERVVDSFLTASPGASLTTEGASAPEDAARVDAGLKLDVSERIAVFGLFEGEFSDRGQSYGGVGGGEGAFYGSGQGQNYAGRVGMRIAW